MSKIMEQLPLLRWLLPCLLLFCFPLPCHSYIDPVDQAALDDFYNSLTGKGPLPSSLPSDWCGGVNGITCDGDGNGKITKIQLSHSQLTGSIPSTLGNLASLQTLNFYNNQLTGSIPSTLGNLTSLQFLALNDNQLTGSIPSTLGNLTPLQTLILLNNQLTGSIPSTLGNLNSLKDLYLRGTNNFCPLADYRSWATGSTDFPTYPNPTHCNACTTFTCQNNGTCSGGQNELFSCNCTHGWMGDNCQESVPCNASTYYSVDVKRCLPCPVNSSSPSQSISLTSCICTQPGYFLSMNISTCLACPNSTFLNPQKNECQACPASTSSPEASPSITSCKCNQPGYFLSLNPSTCLACPSNTFLNSQNECQACPASSSSPEASPSITSCTCSQLGHFPDSDTLTCQPCLADSFLNPQNGCQACPANSTSPEASPSINSCKCNQPGYFLSLNTSACLPCPNNTFLNPQKDGCQACPASSSSPEASPSISSCTCTQTGYFPDPNIPTCLVCPNNTFLNPQNGCQACPASSTSSLASPSITSCKCNQPGYFPDSNTSTCRPCSNNTFLNSQKNGCQACPSNSFSPEASSSITSCICNQPGYFPDPQTLTCLPCSSNTFLDSQKNECQVCPANSTSSLASPSISSCKCNQPGYFPDSNPSTCLACPSNTFLNLQNECQACPASSSSPEASPSISSCTCNQTGYFPDSKTSTCRPCLADSFLNSQNGCQACPANSTSPEASPSITSCNCSFGLFLNPTSNLCEIPECPSTSFNSSTFGITKAGAIASGTCDPNFFVFEDGYPIVTAPQRSCLLNSDGKTADWGDLLTWCEPSCKVIGSECENGSKCFSNGVTSYCNCNGINFIGRRCETSFSCSDIHCQNGGFCSAAMKACDCTGTGYQGNFCQLPKEGDCRVSGGHCAHGSCKANLTDFGFCDCSGTGYTGESCQLPKGGDCRIEANHCAHGYCVTNSSTDQAFCDCSGTGHNGASCQVPKEGDCRIEANRCAHGYCVTNSSTDLASCDCTGTGFGGDKCQVEILDCTFFPCKNDGRCNLETRRCDCSGTLFNGSFCEVETTQCEGSSSCSGAGTCQDVGVNLIACTCTSSLTIGETCAINLIPIIALATAFFFVTLIYLFLQHLLPQCKKELKNPSSFPINNMILFSLFFAIYDFVSDCLFVFEQSARAGNPEEAPYFYSSLTFVILPIFFNLIVLSIIFWKLFKKSPSMQQWVAEGNYVIFVAAILLASTHPDSLLFITSGIIGLKMFQAPIPIETRDILKISGVVGIFLEDIPQLVIQSWVAHQSGPTTITILSLIASIVTIFFGLGVRAVLFLVYQAAKKNPAIRKGTEISLTLREKEVEKEEEEKEEIF